MQVIISVDDYGRSLGITDSILSCFDKGSINSVSLFATGDAYQYALEEYKKRKGLRLALHLDLVEGSPLSLLENISYLVTDSGKYKYSFVTLWLTYIISGKERKRKVKKQIKREIKAQISKVVESLGEDFSISLDSHMHMHMIPFVFDIVIELAGEFNISYIRLARERFFLHVDGFRSLKNYFSTNIIKHMLLNLLAKKHAKALRKKDIKSCDFFIGSLFTGNMSVGVVEDALKVIPRTDANSIIEILFHSGKALPEERVYLERVPYILDYYLSNDRDREREALQSGKLDDVVENFISGN